MTIVRDEGQKTLKEAIKKPSLENGVLFCKLVLSLRSLSSDLIGQRKKPFVSKMI
jgi:hypothetical protein